jgi:predicted transcriptional regulator of viral defense system
VNVEEYRQLGPGELTEIIIGTVVNHEVYLGHHDGISAAELARLLNPWNIRITENHARTRLNELANKGRIERVSRGRFTGV